jgi:hypothetical protein
MDHVSTQTASLQCVFTQFNAFWIWVGIVDLLLKFSYSMLACCFLVHIRLIPSGWHRSIASAAGGAVRTSGSWWSAGESYANDQPLRAYPSRCRCRSYDTAVQWRPCSSNTGFNTTGASCDACAQRLDAGFGTRRRGHR